MYSSEKKTIFNVLVLYLFSTIFLISVLGFSYYFHEKEKIQKEVQNSLLVYAKDIHFLLEQFHNKPTDFLEYPKTEGINSAIFDIDKNLLYATFKDEKIDFEKSFYYKNGISYLIYEIHPFYMGVKYIVISKKTAFIFDDIKEKILSLVLFVILILVITSLFLVKLILKPLRNNLQLLDNFIKDTTHELNTPISTILTNTELLNKKAVDSNILNYVTRIKTASITISNIYEDLVFITLNHKNFDVVENIDLNELFKQRVDYFDTFFKTRDLKVFIKEEKSSLNMDKKKAIRLIDNLLSNAIKYSNRKTNIEINITSNYFSITNEGKGMTKDEISRVFDRYSRFDKTQGGFGLGFNIIYNIAKEYKLKIDITSKVDEKTCVKISW